MSAVSTTARIPRLPGVTAVPAAVVAAAVVGDALSAAIAAVAHSAGVAHSFKPLQFGTYTGLIVFGVLAGAIGWQVVRTRSRQPGWLLLRLAPVVLVLSFIPDVAIGVTGSQSATWGGVFALMGMHVTVAVSAVASYLAFLPVDKQV